MLYLIQQRFHPETVELFQIETVPLWDLKRNKYGTSGVLFHKHTFCEHEF